MNKPTYEKRVFHHAFGSGLFPVKPYGENIVPIGCFYDSMEVFTELSYRINDSLLPFLKGIEDSLFFNNFNYSMEYDVEIRPQILSFNDNSKWKVGNNKVNRSDLLAILNDENNWIDPNCWGFYLTINCYQGLKEWGAQFRVNLDKHIWSDESDEEEYSVWHLWIDDLYFNLEEKFNNKFIQKVMDKLHWWLQRCYDLSYKELTPELENKYYKSANQN